jgi:exodeoxyribonuclease V alpha subunit
MNEPNTNPNQRETLAGTVEAVIYQNEENGYTVLRLEQEDEQYTLVGCMPGVCAGEEIDVTGSWTRHPSFGPQFKVETLERRIPSTTKAIFNYLASGVVKGIGAMTARRIVDTFGEDSLDIIERDPDTLSTIKGISRKKAYEISENFQKQAGMRHLMEFLTRHELPVSLGTALWRQFGQDALTILKANPYLIAGEPYRIRFSVADQLALSLGIGAEDAMRAEAGVIFELSHNLGNGHVFLPAGKLIPASAKLLGLSEAPIAQALDSLVEQGRVVREQIAGEDACYLTSLYHAEVEVAHRLGEMARQEVLPPSNIDEIISRIEGEQGIRYAPQQRQAVELAAQRQVMLLTGGPGTGKTTSLRGILELFGAIGLKTALAAPTGRAAKRLGDLCGTEATTIHRLLETGYDNETGDLAFCKNESDPLEVGAVIVDETSMVDLPLMNALLAALKGNCRLVLVGDPDQLPSVGPGSLFSDLIRSKAIPAVRLTEIFRQAQESAIVMNAHAVNQGQLPALGNKATGDFFFLRRTDPQRAVDTIVELCKTRLPQNMGIPADQIQVLSPTRKYDTGTRNLNIALQAALNPASPQKNQKKYGSYTYRVGDRVMQIKNNYDIMWREKGKPRGGMGIFNGDVGFIEAIDPQGEVVLVNFDDRMVEYTADMLNELEPAFAMTVHKSQGSEYRAVVLAALDGAPMLLSRGVLYTAITRAKELLVIVGDNQVVAQMCQNNRQARRYTGLRARLAKEG